MTTRFETQVGDLVNGIASCLCLELADAVREGNAQPCICTVMPGAVVAFDYCEEGGMAWARLAGILPVENTQPYTCAVEYDVTVEIGILRCAPGLGEDGELPTMPEQLAASMQQQFEMGLMHKVLSCCATTASFDGPAINGYTPVGPDGGCVGGVWTATWRFS